MNSGSFVVFDDGTQAVLEGELLIDGMPSTTVVSAAGDSVLVIESGTVGIPGLLGPGLPTFVHGGLLQVLAGTGRIYNDTGRDLILRVLRATLEVPPVGTSVIVDFSMDGVSLGLPLYLTEDDRTVTLHADVVWPEDSYLSVAVPQVGSDFPGDTLTVSASAS